MKRWIIILFILLAGGIFLMTDNQTTVEKVEERYTHEGLLHAYPYKENSQYLSESIGLYMEYLVKTDEKKAFAKQVDHLTQSFVQNGHIQWLLDQDVTTNAIIDDARIIFSLKKAARDFRQWKYDQLAENLIETLADTQQVDGYYVDYYDWREGEPAEQITLSYITPALAETLPNSEKTELLLTELDGETVFFPETYQVVKNEYIEKAEIHMVDQLLIALNRERLNLSSPAFHQWLKERWNDGVLHGRYNRETLEPTVSYESLAVYALASLYFSETNQPDKAEEIIDYSQGLSKDLAVRDTHFFDFMYQQLAEYDVIRRNES
ncbi:hypothetical protein LCM20_12535 [Halobacillus litoralis]|uniref:hypothetical protein n=1 Tax=Halobacillus litoralis TaxID=45668 RepID=UPI001CD2E2FB|nr:hypothetical protein [Halobacillus litoralis]MCA0971424.1 hypothetical protein [Halobacillus litoralis]